jgi:hypothetical protein
LINHCEWRDPAGNLANHNSLPTSMKSRPSIDPLVFSSPSCPRSREDIPVTLIQDGKIQVAAPFRPPLVSAEEGGQGPDAAFEREDACSPTDREAVEYELQTDFLNQDPEYIQGKHNQTLLRGIQSLATVPYIPQPDEGRSFPMPAEYSDLLRLGQPGESILGDLITHDTASTEVSHHMSAKTQS